MIIAVNFQFKQLERRSLKKIRASTGFEPVTSGLQLVLTVAYRKKSIKNGVLSIKKVSLIFEIVHFNL